jgi:beta-lactamase class A
LIGRALLIVALLACGACADAAKPVVTRSSSTSSALLATTTTAAASTTSTTAGPGEQPRLQDAIDDFTARQDVPFSVVAVDLTSGARASHLGDRQVLSASLYKLFVARELLRRIDANTLDRNAPAGTNDGRTIGDCIHDMIVVSDNDCGVAGLNIVGFGQLDASLHAEGFTNTSLASPQQTSADDVAALLTAEHNGNTELYQLLREQQVNDRFTLGLPAGTPLAHKTGDRREWAHDAGVITTPHGDLLLVGLSGPWPDNCCDADNPGPAEAKAFGALGDLAAAVYAAAS